MSEQQPEYRVDELARRAGTSVRNVRVYQDRGLLDPPRRQGRVGYYSDAHLDRLRLIGRLLDRGYTFGTIAELLAAWCSGAGLSRVLGLTDAIGGPWSEETPDHVSLTQLRRRFGIKDTSTIVSRAVEVGVLEPEGSGFRVPSPHLLDAGADLVAAGIPLNVVLDLTSAVRAHLDGVAELVFSAVATHLPGLSDVTAQPADATVEATEAVTAGPDDRAAQVADLVAQLRPHARRAVEALFALAMRDRAEQAVQELTRAGTEDDRLTG